MIDADEQIDAVHRDVGRRKLDDDEAATIVLSRRFDAGRDEVWDACTDAGQISEWFLPISGDL